MKTITILIPAYNEEATIKALYDRLAALATQQEAYAWEFLFVDDGSTDATNDRLHALRQDDPRVSVVTLSRNFGQQNALLAGLHEATGDAVVCMDADLQHPVELVPQLIRCWEDGYEVVNTRRNDTATAGLAKRFTSRMFYRLLNYLTDLDMATGFADFRLLDRTVVNVIRECREDGLFLRGMIRWCGFRQTLVDYDAAPRFAGETKYSYKRMLKLSLNGVTSFSIRPLRLSIVLAAVLALLCAVEIGYALYMLLVAHGAVSGWTSTVILISLIGAMTLLMLGVIGEYVGRTFMQSKGRPPYIIRFINGERPQ